MTRRDINELPSPIEIDTNQFEWLLKPINEIGLAGVIATALTKGGSDGTGKPITKAAHLLCVTAEDLKETYGLRIDQITQIETKLKEVNSCFLIPANKTDQPILPQEYWDASDLRRILYNENGFYLHNTQMPDRRPSPKENRSPYLSPVHADAANFMNEEPGRIKLARIRGGNQKIRPRPHPVKRGTMPIRNPVRNGPQ